MSEAAKKATTKLHPLAIAWDQWCESEEGRGALKAYDFVPPGQQQYLENRLARAFQAGWRAANIKQPQEANERFRLVKAMTNAGMTNVQIARALEISRERVRQIVDQIRSKPCQSE